MPMPVRSTQGNPNTLSRGWTEDLTPVNPDTVPMDPDAMSMEDLNAFLYDIQDQPEWRSRADVEADYYDSNQYDSPTLKEMEKRGIPPIVVNLTKPTVDLILGLEEKTRRDWIVRPDSDEYEEEALALSKELHTFERLSGADTACGGAYQGQVKAGLGWVEVGLNHLDPFGYRFRCKAIHRREIWWDWHDDDPTLQQARWLVRRKWYDKDVAQAYFPQFGDLFEQVCSGWSAWDPSTYVTRFGRAPPMYMDQTIEREFFHDMDEWRNTLRKMVCLYEVWYRTYKTGFVLRSRDDKDVLEFNRNNPMHIAAIERGVMRVEPAIIPKMRLSWWAGPHRLVDMPTPYPHQWFPYVPFWGYREDRTGVPYGCIRTMRPLQDEINARRAKMLWQLSAVRTIVDEDAVLNHDKAMKEIARPDAYIKLNPARKNKAISEAIKIEEHTGLTAQQFEVYMDSKQTLQDAGGVYQQQLGKDGAADSGIAISQLIEQGTTTLAHINGNFGRARTRVGEIALALVKHQMSGRPFDSVIEVKGIKKRVFFNVETEDPDNPGMKYLENDITKLRMRVALDDLPQTPTFKQQQFLQLTELVKSLPENLQGMVMDLVIKASDLPEKEQLIQRIRGALGIQDTDVNMMTPQEQQQFLKQQQMQAQMEAMQQKLVEMEIAVQDATAKDKNSSAKLKEAQTVKTYVEVGMDPRTMAEPIREADPTMDMLQQAMIDEDSDVPGADPVLMERARRSGGTGNPPPAGGKTTTPKSEAASV